MRSVAILAQDLMSYYEFRAVAPGHVAKPEWRPQGVPLDIDKQTTWHTSLTDQFKNFYRTSYQDMILQREVAVKSAKPEGYCGYDVYRGANELYRNTEFDKMQQVISGDETRLRFPDFTRQKEGLPDFTSNPQGKTAQKTAKTLPSGFVVPPYSVDQHGPVLNFLSHVSVLPPYEFRRSVGQPMTLAQPVAQDRAVQPVHSARALRAADVVAEAPAPKSRPVVQIETMDEAVGPGPAVVPVPPESERLAAAGTYVLNNGARSPRKSESPRKSPKQLLAELGVASP